MADWDVVVFDMAGTTVRDRSEVEACFLKAARETDLPAESDQIVSMMGWSKRLVFETLWKQQGLSDAEEVQVRVDRSYDAFRSILEGHYETQAVEPSAGCLDCFSWLQSQGIAVALTTGFYRRVTDIILGRLGWDVGLDTDYCGSADSRIQASVASDQVAAGQPAADMIQRAMQLTGTEDSGRVVKVGDTPSDLQSGRAAQCGLV
ncbi:MAG: HAD family hydrolase, partial [Planctomycetaceae bacterium]